MDALASAGLAAAKLVLLLAGLLVPGALLMRALRVPATVATSFAGSAFALYGVVVALQLAGMRIALGSMAAGLAVVTALCFVARPRRGGSLGIRIDLAGVTPPREIEDTHAISRGVGSLRLHQSLLSQLKEQVSCMGAWTPVYLLFWAASLWRIAHEPLAGPDIEFRWGFLAEQMLRQGSLDFYPPRAAGDFLHYFWVENIPPGASALHAWAFACAGRTSLVWAAPAVALQLWAIHALLWRTAERMGGIPAARVTVLAAAACPLLTWSVLLGQETGLTTLSLIGIVFAADGWRRIQTPGWAALAGVFATLGAAAREYGLVFPVLAACALLLVRADRRGWLAFAAAAAVSLIWPLRGWLLTGNPFYSLAVAGLLPINPRFLAWINHDAANLGASLHTVSGWSDVLRYLFLFAPAALLGWLLVLGFGAVRRTRDALWASAALLIPLALWAASVRYTNGGLFYSLRVASPAIALGALAVGLAVKRPAAIALLAILALGGAAGTLALPLNPLRAAISAWPGFAPRAATSETDEALTVIPKHAAPATGAAVGLVLADAPGVQPHFLPAGVGAVPLWSPQADAFFDRSLSTAEAARRWRESGIRYLVVTKYQTNVDFLNRYSRWSAPPFHLQQIGETSGAAIFLIRAE